MTILSYPKINIFLHVGARDKNGLHKIKSRFYKVQGALFDEIEILESRELKISGNFDCKMKDNLIYKAISELKNELEKNSLKSDFLTKLHVKVNKNIPTFAGLGGGSSNAASVLLALNDRYCNLPKDRLIKIASRIGSDVGFFTLGAKSANVSGFGQIVQEFSDDDLEFSLITPNIKCATKEIFLEFDRAEQPCRDFLKNDFFSMKSSEILKNSRLDLNCLLKPALALKNELKELDKTLGSEWFFSGSGSSYFKVKSGNSEE